ncbi:hypothetical protein OBBRIDRAFT_862959 [Obba rivulosa]|uniref:Uncharacterized protein n=1 Tax=Obba rivulosa TaxID=1052685 RepID=A0A8E2B397_9APHY|nr:hypothetical protein OBBRIDRAFT_862959 [Obba rivulosa]
MRVPTGENATEVTPPECPSSSLINGSPVPVSHTRRIVLSSAPGTMRVPSGKNATEVTPLERLPHPEMFYRPQIPISLPAIHSHTPSASQGRRRSQGEPLDAVPRVSASRSVTLQAVSPPSTKNQSGSLRL